MFLVTMVTCPDPELLKIMPVMTWKVLFFFFLKVFGAAAQSRQNAQQKKKVQGGMLFLEATAFLACTAIHHVTVAWRHDPRGEMPASLEVNDLTFKRPQLRSEKWVFMKVPFSNVFLMFGADFTHCFISQCQKHKEWSLTLGVTDLVLFEANGPDAEKLAQSWVSGCCLLIIRPLC